MNVPHVRVVKPLAMKGVLASGRSTRFFLTLPGMDEVEVTSMRGAELATSIDGADEVVLRLYASLEVLYE